jgi:hypothetical protein
MMSKTPGPIARIRVRIRPMERPFYPRSVFSGRENLRPGVSQNLVHLKLNSHLEYFTAQN